MANIIYVIVTILNPHVNLKQKITHNLLNIPGWRTKRHIVVIESDNWGTYPYKSVGHGKKTVNYMQTSNDRLTTKVVKNY